MICGKCNNNFKTLVVIDGKIKNLSSRKYCLNCSPFGANNRKQLETSKTNQKTRQDGNQVKCQNCSKEYIYKRQTGATTIFCVACLSKLQRHKLKIKAVIYKGGKCVKCGYSKCVGSLQFHHLNPEEKDFTLSNNHGKWEVIQKELDKCILICANCHGEEHFTKMKSLDYST